MALHHHGAALLALSILLGILGFLQASNTPTIPVDQLTVEQAYLEYYLIERQLLSANPPNITAEQKVIFDRLFPVNMWHFLKPNDQLPSTLRQQMSDFRRVITNWNQPLKLGTVEYQITRGLALFLLYEYMVKAVDKAVKKKEEDAKHQGDQEALTRAWDAVKTLKKVSFGIKFKFDNDKKSFTSEDLEQLEAAIKAARSAVMVTPKFDENGVLIPGSSWKLTTLGILQSEESQSEPDVGESSPAGPNEDFTGWNSVEPARQLSSESTGNLPEGSGKPPNKLFHLLKRPYIWGPALALTIWGLVKYLSKGHQTTSSIIDDHYPAPKITLDTPTIGISDAESNQLWYIIAGAVALIVLIIIIWFCSITKVTKASSKKITTTKRASQKSRQFATKSSLSSSIVGPTST